MPSATDELDKVKQWVDPEEWYAVLDPYSGEVWHELTRDWRRARDIAAELGGGQIVIVTTRIGADEEGEYIPARIP
jgi:sugar phosphate isomerase/epimerase